jgi:hypothetical protein
VAYDNAGPGYNLTGGRPEQVHGIHVTEGYFRVYGAPVALGRTFTPQEDLPHGAKVVVLSYGLWQRRFGGDTAIVGKSLSVGNEPYTVVGVIGRDFVADPQAGQVPSTTVSSQTRTGAPTLRLAPCATASSATPAIRCL